MIVVSDTSVISALIQIGREELLLEIFGEVVIPEKVAAELAVSHPALPP
jgi:predicted nucleic acid-binding protein